MLQSKTVQETERACSMKRMHARGALATHSIHVSALNGAWNHMAWSRDVIICRGVSQGGGEGGGGGGGTGGQPGGQLEAALGVALRSVKLRGSGKQTWIRGFGNIIAWGRIMALPSIQSLGGGRRGGDEMG